MFGGDLDAWREPRTCCSTQQLTVGLVQAAPLLSPAAVRGQQQAEQQSLCTGAGGFNCAASAFAGGLVRC